MKKLTFVFTVVSAMLVPTLLLAQPPRPRPGQVPQARHQVVQTPVRPTMQVYAPPRPVAPPSRHVHTPLPHRPPVVVHPHYSPAYHPPIVQPRVIVAPPIVQPAVVAPPMVVPYNYYPPVSSGFSLTIGGKNGVFSIATGY